MFFPVVPNSGKVLQLPVQIHIMFFSIPCYFIAVHLKSLDVVQLSKAVLSKVLVRVFAVSWLSLCVCGIVLQTVFFLIFSWHALDVASHSNKARALMKNLGTFIYNELIRDRAPAQGGQTVTLQLHGAEKFPALLVIGTHLLTVCWSPYFPS